MEGKEERRSGEHAEVDIPVRVFRFKYIDYIIYTIINRNELVDIHIRVINAHINLSEL